MAETKDDLPVLPTPFMKRFGNEIPPEVYEPWRDQMRAYATEACTAAQSRIKALEDAVEGLRKDAERLEFILSCDFLAARTYLPDLNANDFIAKRRASLDEQIARRASLSSGRSGSGEVSNG